MNALGDIRFAIRTLIASRGFTAVAVLCLALGIGANSAIFTIVDRTMLRSLPYEDPDQLVAIHTRFESFQLDHYDLSLHEVRDLRAKSKLLSSISAYGVIDANVSLHMGEAPQRVVTVVTDPNTLNTLGVEPALGRNFRPEEAIVGNELVVILSHELWQREYRGDHGVLGRTMVIDTEPHVIIGIMPPGFRFPFRPVDIIAPLAFRDELDSSRAKRTYGVIARMHPGASTAELQDELDGITAQFAVEYPNFYPPSVGYSLDTTSLHDALYGSMRLAMIALLAAVGLVLLIACANVAGLLLARGVTRERELAVRAALGASRGRLIRQLMTESMVLASLGAAGGLLGALWGTDLLIALYPDSLPHLAAVSVDRSVLMFTIVIAVFAGLVAGVMPAIQSSKIDLHSSLKDGGNPTTVGRRRRRIRNTLVAGEIALSLVLLVGAGLMIKSLATMQQANLGFRARDVTAMRFKLPWPDYMMKIEARRDFLTQLIDRVEALPETGKVAVATYPPLNHMVQYVSAGVADSNHIDIDAKECQEDSESKMPPAAQLRLVSPDYFDILGIDLIAGRAFTDADRDEKRPVVIVDETLAEYFPDDCNPAESGVLKFSKNDNWLRVVGVVRHVKAEGVNSKNYPQLYVPMWSLTSLQATLLIETDADLGTIAAAVQREVWELDSRVPVFAAETMQDRIADSLALQRFASMLLAIFAALALFLASAGVYAVMSYSVTQRRREIGIRLALGARPAQITAMIMRQGAVVAVTGAIIGLIGAGVFGSFADRLLYDISPIDPIIFVTALVAVLVAAMGACYLAARRATRIDPMDALRGE